MDRLAAMETFITVNRNGVKCPLVIADNFWAFASFLCGILLIDKKTLPLICAIGQSVEFESGSERGKRSCTTFTLFRPPTASRC
jgi:hypothetical protein